MFSHYSSFISLTSTCIVRLGDICRGGSRISSQGGRTLKILFGVFRVKNRHFTQKIHLFQFQEGSAPGAPPSLDPPLIQELRVAESSSYPLHPAFNEKCKNYCDQLQCISSTLYSLTSINCVVTVRGVADCRNLTDGRTNGRISSV